MRYWWPVAVLVSGLVVGGIGYTLYQNQIPTAPNPVVEELYPTTTEIPENILRLYLYFSEPMKDGQTLRSVHVYDDRGAAVNVYDPDSGSTGIFLETLEELWSPDYKRITLILDPGRVKTDLDSHDALGRSFERGRTYTLEVDTTLESAAGKHLSEVFRKQFTVIPEDRTPPNTSAWNIETPEAGTLKPLTITFDEVLDHAQVVSFIRVYDGKNNPVTGEVKLASNEQIWEFYPNVAWQNGEYEIRIDVRLEDIAGNSLQGKFDRNTDTDELILIYQYVIILPFTM